MDIEQLKLVMETVKSVSGSAQAVAIWWIVLDKLLPILAWLIAGFGTYKLFATLLGNLRSYADLCEIRDMLNIGSSGALMDWERREIIAKIRKLGVK